MDGFHYLYDLPLDIISTLLDNVVETIGIAETARLRLSLGIPTVAASVNRFDILRLLCERLQVPLNNLRHLNEAARYGHLGFVKLCIANGAIVNGNATPQRQKWDLESPLYVAASREYRNVVKFLLAAGADPTNPQVNEQALTGAARAGHHHLVVEVLLDSGIELWYKDISLSVAARKGYESLVRLLVSRGARVDGIESPTLDGLDPPMLEAMKYRHGNVVNVLRELGAKETVLPQGSYADVSG
ncbi:ankyrin repeat-containing domain protein [Rhexocercosporidium sp. MPI-PUGE-AT-0058]|nr:ankyrin repeat-containing domain protein [Rhexocercosporidium sp. MPI-PUGE-AT-0058]